MLLEAALTAYLKADAGVSAIVGDRVFPELVPQGQPYPAVVYRRSSDDTVYSLSGSSGVVAAKFEIGGMSDSFSDPAYISEAVRLALQDFVGLMGDVTIQEIKLVGRADRTTPLTPNAASQVYYRHCDFEIWYEEDAPDRG